jgi:polysaccharide pyruvyl transferase WcaK-like protein
MHGLSAAARAGTTGTGSRTLSMNKMNPKICLLGASFGTNNMGVNALTAGTLKAFFEHYPGGEMFLLDYGKKEITCDFQLGDSLIPVQLVNIRFSKKFYLKNNIAWLIALALFARSIPSRKARKHVISGNYWLSRVAEADIVVSMAGGDSFSDIYGMGRLLYVALPQILALILGKKLVFLPQTIGPFKGAAAKMIARIIMRRAVVIYSRDREGIGDAKALLGAGSADGKVRFCYDVGFVVDPVKPRGMDLDGLQEGGHRDLPVVGFNVSGLLFMGGYTQNNMFRLKIDYRQLVYDVIEYLIHVKKAAVVLVPHVFGPKEHAESDSAVCEIIYAELKQRYQDTLYMARGSYDQGEIKYIIGTCDFFIGSRMHACIAALSQNVPTVSIAYSRKFTGVMESIGVEALVADPRKLGQGDILPIISRVYDQRASLHLQLEQTIPGVKKAVLQLFPDIVSAV